MKKKIENKIIYKKNTMEINAETINSLRLSFMEEEMYNIKHKKEVKQRDIVWRCQINDIIFIEDDDEKKTCKYAIIKVEKNKNNDENEEEKTHKKKIKNENNFPILKFSHQQFLAFCLISSYNPENKKLFFNLFENTGEIAKFDKETNTFKIPNLD